ncbi:MAG: hypothetical protein ABSA59_24505 [Terriglobia bacterium]
MKKVLLLCAVLVVFLVLGQKASWADGCPATTLQIGDATGCEIITVGTGGSLSFSTTPGSPVIFLGGSDDPLVEVINNSGYTLSSLDLTGTGVFAFNGDGLCSGGYMNTPDFCPNPLDDSDGFYAGPTTFFSADPGGAGGLPPSTGTFGYVNFVGGLPNEGETYFSLEDVPYGGTPVGAAEPDSAQLLLLATALSGLGMFVKRLRMG